MGIKTAIITGSSRGIGKATAIRFAKSGINLMLNARTNSEALKETVDICKGFGIRVETFIGDLSIKENCEKLIEKSIEEFKNIDILINNAGITRDNLILKMTYEEFNEVIDINLRSAFYMIKNITRKMMKQRSGVIINISSIVGINGNAGQVNYSASKAGVIGLTKSAAKELAARNIRVNAIAPGFIETDMTKKLDEKIIKEMSDAIPLKRLGKAEDIANLIKFLVSDEADYITGEVINISGGMLM